MLGRRDYILPIFVLVGALLFTYWRPSLIWLWLLLFVLLTSFFFLYGFFVRFQRMDRWLRKREFARLISECEPIFKRSKNRNLRQIAALYLAAAYLGQQGADAADYLDRLFVDFEPSRLSNRWQNRHHLVQAQWLLYKDEYQEALQRLEKSSLHKVGLFYLSRLLYYFSLLFFLTKQQQQRSMQYAAKAFELMPDERLYQAHYGLLLFQLQKERGGLKLLQQTLAAWDDGCYPWERRMYERFAGENSV